MNKVFILLTVTFFVAFLACESEATVFLVFYKPIYQVDRRVEVVFFINF